MPKNIPSLKPRELIRLLRHGGCSFYRKGKGDHQLYVRYCEGRRRFVEMALNNPDEIVPGHKDRTVYHKIIKGKLLRVVTSGNTVITAYLTSKINKYTKGE